MSCRSLFRSVEKPSVIPIDTPPHSFSSNARQLVPIGCERSVFPFGDSALRHQRNRGHAGLRDVQDTFSDVKHGAHEVVLFENALFVKAFYEISNFWLPYPCGSEGQMVDDVDDVGKDLRELLAITKLTQTALGKKLGVSQATISKWMNGVHDPSKAEWDRFKRFAIKKTETAHLARRGIGPPADDDPLRAELYELVSLATPDETKVLHPLMKSFVKGKL